MAANLQMSSEWVARFQLGHCDGHIIVEPDVRDVPTPELSAVRETPINEVDRRVWRIRDMVVSLRTQKP
jgi:hypothetical protein